MSLAIRSYTHLLRSCSYQVRLHHIHRNHPLLLIVNSQENFIDFNFVDLPSSSCYQNHLHLIVFVMATIVITMAAEYDFIDLSRLFSLVWFV